MRFALALRLLRAEGPRALVERWRDRRLDARRARRFAVSAGDGESGARAAAGTVAAEARSPTLWVLPFPLQRRSGGAAIQLLVRLEERATALPVAVVQRLPGRLRCELWGRGVARPLAREWAVASESSPLLDPSPLPILLAAAAWVGARRVHFESLVDLPLALPLAVQAHGLEIGLSAHDFALFCPRPHLIEEPEARFCGFSTDPQRCSRCLATRWALPEGYQEARREAAGRLAAAASVLEFPSEFMRREHLRLFPGISPELTRVLPPRSLAQPLALPLRPVRRPPQRIALAGAVHRHKGAREFEAVVQELAARRPGEFEWHVFGGGDPASLQRLRRLPRTTVHGYYRAGSLPARLRAARIDLALLPSIWPEAHCLVLDECALAGVPVVAFDLGALGERVRAGDLGVLVDPRTGAPGLAAAIADLR